MRDERLNNIINIVNEEENISVKELSKRLSYAESTLRNDLNILNKKGLIKRVHGGACSIKNNKSDKLVLFENRLVSQIDEKRNISKKAINFISDNDTIALDGSTTCYELSKLINATDLKLNIVTNSVMTSLIFQNNPNITITLIGGILSKESMSSSGILGIDLLNKININTFFFSSSSIDIEGLTDFNIQEIELKKVILEKSRNSIALVDNTKFDSRSLANICDITYINTIITDFNISQYLIDKYSKLVDCFIY